MYMKAVQFLHMSYHYKPCVRVVALSRRPVPGAACTDAKRVQSPGPAQASPVVACAVVAELHQGADTTIGNHQLCQLWCVFDHLTHLCVQFSSVFEETVELQKTCGQWQCLHGNQHPAPQHKLGSYVITLC